jgi:hypothetical protein
MQGAAFEELAEGSEVVIQPSDHAAGDKRDEGPCAVSVRLAAEV